MKSELLIETGLNSNITFLKNSYCTVPFKIANITEDQNDLTLRLMLMTSSPGILNKDNYYQKINLIKGSSLQLRTQSYQRLFNMNEQASQLLEVFQQPYSSFTFIAHPVVPHLNSSFSCRNKIFLTEHCSLVWGEILTCGRKLNGEIFHFASFQNLTEIYLSGTLVIRENLLIDPNISDIRSMGQLENYTHQASLFYLDENANARQLILDISSWMKEQDGIIYGITATAINGFNIKILGYGAEQLYNIMNDINSKFIVRQKFL